MSSPENSKDLKKSKFKDSKVDMKEVFSEKTDLDSQTDDISTFSTPRFIQLTLLINVLIRQKGPRPTGRSARATSRARAKTSPSFSGRCSS